MNNGNGQNHDPVPDYWPLKIPIVVAWGDMDALGHVNNTRFLRWFEDARFEVFQRIGSRELGPDSCSGPILARVECIFRSPVLHPDTITSMIRTADIGTDRYTLEHRLESQQQGKVVALGTSRIVQINYQSGQKVALSRDVLAQLEQLR